MSLEQFESQINTWKHDYMLKKQKTIMNSIMVKLTWDYLHKI